MISWGEESYGVGEVSLNRLDRLAVMDVEDLGNAVLEWECYSIYACG